MKKEYSIYHLAGITIIAGMSVFSMFFGSGNLVFPLSIGMKSGQHLFMGILGLVITGVLVPFLGLYGIIMYNGDRNKYFSTIHPYLPQIITALILGILGPFGVVPRCILVAYGGVTLILPNLQLWIFSGIFCVLVFFMIRTKRQIVEVMGKYLTPFLLFGVAAIILFGIVSDFKVVESDRASLNQVFSDALLTGYNTMDLLAAFFFGITIKQYLNYVLRDHTDAYHRTICGLGTCFIAMLLLTIVYAGFIMIGNKYAEVLNGVAPESYLAHIADITLGGYSKYVAAITIALACFTTAVILTRLFADFVQATLFKNLKNKVWNSKIISLVISFALSLMGFEIITKFLGGILSFLYPALIAIAAGNIIEKIFRIKVSAKLFWLAIASQAAIVFYS